MSMSLSVCRQWCPLGSRNKSGEFLASVPKAPSKTFFEGGRKYGSIRSSLEVQQAGYPARRQGDCAGAVGRNRVCDSVGPDREGTHVCLSWRGVSTKLRELPRGLHRPSVQEGSALQGRWRDGQGVGSGVARAARYPVEARGRVLCVVGTGFVVPHTCCGAKTCVHVWSPMIRLGDKYPRG